MSIKCYQRFPRRWSLYNHSVPVDSSLNHFVYNFSVTDDIDFHLHDFAHLFSLFWPIFPRKTGKSSKADLFSLQRPKVMGVSRARVPLTLKLRGAVFDVSTWFRLKMPNGRLPLLRLLLLSVPLRAGRTLGSSFSSLLELALGPVDIWRSSVAI